MSVRRRVSAKPTSESDDTSEQGGQETLIDDAHPLSGQFASDLERLCRPLRRECDANEKVFLESFLRNHIIITSDTCYL